MDFSPGLWDTPGGIVEEGEPPRDGALRELREETGLRGEVIRLFRRHAHQHPLRPWQRVNERDYLVRCSSRSPVELGREEHSDFRWITTTDVELLPTWERWRITMRRAFQARR